MTISRHFLVVEAAKYQIFSCFVLHVIAVNPIAAFAKFTIGELEPIVVKVRKAIKLKVHPPQPVNAPAQQRKVTDVKTEPPIPVVAVICISFNHHLN